ncbi:helix-turn-helix domain-containing protein [Clostridium tyrobutyricum]|uniref:helix-turn-helix domain-containing protein n=1 Tax=Clostridium tyrobutyricum TaxID=1519 RepID=UPI00073D877C|nr:helix-turn-helix domain-containing protein [Clostridium tyrobutyricum]MBV4441518.1 helix-turn-helix domain-containing protein [Clostridium tyrobutyricum]
MEEYKILQSKPDPTKIMTVRQFYDSTPFGLEKIYQLCHRKDFPSLKVGKKYYILRDEVMNWFRNHTDEQL